MSAPLKALMFLAVGLTLAGCASSSALKSYTNESLPIAATNVMVDDMAERIQSSYAPGQTTIYLSGKDDIALALEDKLRSLGFTLVSESAGGALIVAWTIDQLEPGAWYLLVKLSDGYRFSRVYADNGHTVAADGGLSQGKF